MTPSQAYAQWKQYAADPADSEAQSIQKFSQQFGIAPEQEEELYKAYPDQPRFRAPRKSGFLSQTFGAGVDELQKSLGSSLAGPGAETLSDLGWEGGAGFLEDIGSDIVKQQEIDLQEYEAPQTREELIKEGGVLGSLYENVFSPVLQTPQQMGRQALPSLGAAGVALGAAGVAALASGGNPFIVGATAMAVGNAVGSFQVGGEEFETAKRDPFIRKQLGIDPNADFADLTPDQQRTLTDSAQRIAKETMVERLYQGGALESLAFIPYGPLALRYLADIGLGATSEEMDKRLGMENTIQELQRLGVSRAEIPELREKMKGLRPGTMETMLNAAVMEATFGSPTAIIETIAQPDSRVDQYLTAKKGKADKLKILDKNIEEAMADPIKLQKAENDLIEQDEKRATRRRKEAERLADRQKKLENEAEVDLFKQQQKLNEMTGQDDMGRTIESSEVNGFPDYIFSQAGMTTEQVDAAALKFAEEESARAEAWAKQETDRQFEAEGKKKKKKKTTSISKSAREEVVIEGEGVTNSLDAMDNVAEGTAIDSPESDPNQSFISIDKITQQVALNEYMAAFPEINFKGSTLVKDKDGVPQIIYEDENGDIQSDTDWELMEGFIDDEQIFGKKESPVVYLTQSMYDEGGHLITDTKAAIERMTEVAFHEAIGHAGLRNLLSAGKMLDVDPKRDEKGKITNKDYQRWEGEQYNRFIDGFRNRHRKMIDNWAKGDGKEYLKESEFRQTEEFIARNYGEAGGGKPIGFFDNAAILLREINPFIGNSLTQHQVAKQLQLVVDRYATGIKGKAPSKKNILSGAELVGTIARAATQAGLEEELKTETDIELTSPRREKAKAERKGLETLKAPETTYEVMAPEQVQEEAQKRKETEAILGGARKKQIAGVEKALGAVDVIEKKGVATEAENVRAEARAQEKKKMADTALSNKPRTTPEALAELAKSENKTIRINVAEHENTSNKTLEMLSDPKKNGDSQGTINAALKSINKRKGEVKTWRKKESTRKKKLKDAEKIVADLKKQDTLGKAEKNKLRKNKKLVTALSKEIPAPKHYTPTKTKSKRSKKRKTSLPLTTLEATPLGMAIRKLLLGPEHRETEAHRGKTPIAPSEGESYFKIKKNSKGDPILDKDGKIQGEWRNKKRKGVAHLSEAASTAYLPESQQKGMTLHVERKKGETDAQVKARHKRKIKGIYKKSIADKTDPGAPLTEETKGLSRIDTKALNYEGWAMGVTFVGDETLQFEANQRTQALFYDNRVNRSADEFAEIAILEEGIKKELQAIADNEKLLKEGFPVGAKGAVRATKRQIEASKIRIKSKEDKILGLRKRMGNNLEEAFERVKNEVDQEALLMYFGIHEDHGNLTLEEIGEIMSRPEYVQSFKEKYPDGKIKERLSYKNIFDAIGRALKQMSGNPDVKSEDYLPLAQYYHEVKGVGYDPKTGLFEGGKIQKQLTKREEGKSTLEIKKMVSELYPPGTVFTLENGRELKTKGGRLSPRYVKGSKELKAERLAAIQDLYKKHKVVVKPDLKTHESTRKWGVSRKDMDWAKKNDYPPYAREGKIVKEKKIIKDEEQIEFRSKEGKEAAKTIDALVENNLDYYIKNPHKLYDLPPGMLDLVAERASKEGIKFAETDDGGKTRSKRTFIPNVPKDIKYNKLQRWVYALLGPTEKALDYTRKSLGRTAKKYQEASPKNSHSKYVLPNGNIFYIGKNKTTDNWIEQVESVLNDKEIMSAKRWYPTVKPAFEKAFGKEEAPKMMLAWALANKGESPLGAMKNILKVGQNLKKYLKAEYTKKGGLADENIIKVLKEELITSGAGVKLYDFVDAAIGMKYRSVAGFDALMGAPAVVDRHTWRDFGFIDNALLNHLKKALPDNKKLKGIKLDRQDPSVTDTEYELAANWLRKMTDDLNARNWKGRSDWKPNEVQAVGWMGITTALGDVGGTPAQVIAETSRTLAFEIDFGEGSPFSKLFGKDFNEVISPEEKERITYLVGDLVADIALKKTGMKQTERIRGYGYYEDGGANPNVILKVSGTDPAMADIMNVIGLLAQQTDVIAFGPKTGARGVGFDFRDKNNKLKNKDTQDKLYNGLREAFPNYVLGASQTTIKGKNGLRIVLDNAQAKKGKTVAETQQNVADLGRKIKREMWPVLKNLAQDLNLDLQLEMFQAETFYANNDWKENKNGERFIRGIDSRFRPSVSRRIVDNDTARIQRKIQTEIEKSKNKTAKAPEGKDLNVLETDVNPVFIRSVTTPNFRLQPVSKSRRSKPDISRSRHAAGADQRFGSRWTNFWLGQINKIRPLSKLSPESKEAYIKLRQVAFGQLAQWEHFSSSVYKALVDSKQSKEIYKYLTTPNASSSIISDPNERIHAEKAKRAIDKIGETLVSKKLMKETTLRDFKKKHGDYLPRVYLRHLLDENDRTAIARGLKPSNLEYLKQRRDIPKGVRELILGELTDQPGAPALLASRALMVPGKDLAIMNWMQKMKDLSIDKNLGWVVPNQFVTFNTLEEARTVAKNLKISDAVMKKLELDVDFSDMSTEVTPAWLAAESDKLRIMAMDLQGDTKKIVTELYRRMEDEAKKMEPMFKEGVKIEGYTKLPNSARYGAMRGMWMHKQIADDIIGGMKMATGDESNWEKLVGDTGKMGQYNAYWKWAKVAGNPPSWARNYISNNILLTLAGIPFWSIPGLNIAAAKEMLNKGKYYQIALKQGVMSGNMSHAELGKLETDFKRIQRKMQEDKNPLLWLQGGIGALMEKTSNIYGGIETLGKIGAIKYAMEKKGMNESEAAAFANKWLFDYGLVTPSVRYASTAVVGAPFIRFQSHAIPLMLEVALTKPWRFLPYYALGYGMVELFKNNHDLDEEDFEAIKLALPEWLQEKAITPSIGSIPLLPPNILPLPSKDAQGRWVIHDVSYLMPWGMMSEVAGEVSKGRFGDAMKSLGLLGGPLADAMVVLKTGVDPFTRRPITDDTKDWTSQAGDYKKYMMNMSTPSMFHSSHGAAVRAYDSIVGNLDPKTGELKYEPWQALPRLFGQNLYATNLVEQRRTNLRRMRWEIGNLKAAWKRQLRGLMRSKAPREEIQEARDEYMELLKEKQEEMGTYIKKSRVPASLRAG